MDVAGVVEQAGNNVTKFKRGDAVYAYLSFEEQGGYAEFAVANQDHAALKPRSIDFEKAAAVPLAATTAWQALVRWHHCLNYRAARSRRAGETWHQRLGTKCAPGCKGVGRAGEVN